MNEHKTAVSSNNSPLGDGGGLDGGIIVPAITPLTQSYELDEAAVENCSAVFISMLYLHSFWAQRVNRHPCLRK
jgi:hypothetical protein